MNNGFLNGQFLLAMPGMTDERFARSVIYVCAHSEQGTMGFVINQLQSLEFPDLLVRLGIITQAQSILLPEKARSLMVRRGGPVETGRGFVLHSDDFMVGASIPITDDICMTATMDILHAISDGIGPDKTLMALGYAGWDAGQIEREIANNDWLICEPTDDLLFDGDILGKYDRVMVQMGVDPGRFVPQAGHA
ncbi:YqgE/AlgH family protein [Pseudochrobactrum sp. sp1633]|nr:YqgE/AlgH family protein [Pseudochrobactrum sp. sp1633]MDM8345260.1 YqgE/AlgH family protein [Pseudochrobactrum sp. sp1633]HWD12889.1 YqgE/AlgH family protein [Pseudochrobactrum sp.]